MINKLYTLKFVWIASFLAMTATRIVIARNEAIQKLI